MKRFFVVCALCLALLPVVPSFGGENVPLVIERIVQNCDFFARPWALWGYEKYFLIDVNRLNEARIGIDLISPSGFETRLVYDVETQEVVYSETFLPEKYRREAMRRESIRVIDAVKLAQGLGKYQNSGHDNW